MIRDVYKMGGTVISLFDFLAWRWTEGFPRRIAVGSVV